MATWSLNTPRLGLSSLKLSINGITIIGNTVSTIKESVTGEFLFGNGMQAIGIIMGTLSGEANFGFIPEEHDKILQAAAFWAEYPMAFTATMFEPASGVLYTASNDTIWMRDAELDIAREGAVIKSKFLTQAATSWNGITAIDLASRATDPTSLGALFAGAGLTF
jgi:hypothetical protein